MTALPLFEALADPLHGEVSLFTNWTDTPAVDFVKFIRIDSVTGTETAVRTHTSTDTTGEYIELSGGAIIVYDTEVPMDTSVRYRVEGLGSATTVTSTDLFVSSTGNIWLKDPIRPALDVRCYLRQRIGNTTCVPGSSTIFIAMDAENRANHSSLIEINDAVYPVPVSKPKGSIASVLTVATRTFLDRDNMVDLTAPGTPLLIQAPAQYGIGDRYFSLTSDMSVARINPDHRYQWRTCTLPHTQTDRPAGMSYGIAGTRWMDGCDVYTTFSSLTSAGIAWGDVMTGTIGANGSGPISQWQTYQAVKDNFTDYTAVYAAGANTYQDILMGT